MIEAFKARTRLDAWLAATRFLLCQPTRSYLNVILDISEPGAASKANGKLRKHLDAFYTARNRDPLHTTAETIFPGWEYMRKGMSGVAENYPIAFAEMKDSDPRSWGTYAHRILLRPKADGSVTTPLANLVARMKAELAHEEGGTFRACYELDVSDSEFDIAIHDATKDNGRRRLPCLSHLSFKLLNRAVHLTALYRSHDYQYKVPGNLLGLARLQSSVAQEVGAELGALTVVSTYAMFEGGDMAEFKALVAEAK